MRLLVDMNLSPRWVEALARYGMTAVHWRDMGDPTASDATIFRRAAEIGGIVLNSDLDFVAILAATGAGGPSVVQLRALDLRPEASAAVLADALAACADDLRAGALLTVEASRRRLTLLPLRR